MSRTINFESAHYHNPKSSIHGHSYKLTYQVESVIDKNGISLSESILHYIDKLIIDKFDRATFIHTKDRILSDVFSSRGYKVVEFNYFPTNEVIADTIYNIINKYVSQVDDVELIKINLNNIEYGNQ